MIDLVKHAPEAEAAGSVRQKSVDTGMALTLLCLIAYLVTQRPGWVVSATTLLVVNMTAPRLFAPASKLWFGLSAVLGAVMSRVILTLVFFLVLTPVGLLRRAMGKDTLKLAAFKRGAGSVFVTRGERFTAADLKAPF
ncbi:MAG: SxtJ family membrane protein [Humidesulfovibrio sp.]|uniref:SxtJ family membrane protein n=1 Tax=Humidesulfovibrio sp. TaxID=2910988 RepID=UPI0027E9FE82|nr:SxtJ family membrane protein [Humidesulfovibrio sp.]MDQ7836832.1 SxtJ family membrane protein [Humidesulfovibrio sp.]